MQTDENCLDPDILQTEPALPFPHQNLKLVPSASAPMTRTANVKSTQTCSSPGQTDMPAMEWSSPAWTRRAAKHESIFLPSIACSEVEEDVSDAVHTENLERIEMRADNEYHGQTHLLPHSTNSNVQGLHRLKLSATKNRTRTRQAKKGTRPARERPDANANNGDPEARKKEKSRAKNKIAAAKCRRTKQIQTANVENRHREMSAENTVLKLQQQQLHAAVMQLRMWALSHQDCNCGVHQFNMLEAKHMYMMGGLGGIQSTVQSTVVHHSATTSSLGSMDASTKF